MRGHYNMQTTNNNIPSIEKFEGTFDKEESGCTILLNETINLIKNLEAGGLYMYLMARPPSWKLNAKHLASEFGCNKDKIYKLLRFLMDLGLLTSTAIKNDAGRFEKRHYRLYLRPVSPCLEKPDVENPDAYITKKIINKEKNNGKKY